MLIIGDEKICSATDGTIYKFLIAFINNCQSKSIGGINENHILRIMNEFKKNYGSSWVCVVEWA
jgi:hypothetical protein